MTKALPEARRVHIDLSSKSIAGEVFYTVGRNRFPIRAHTAQTRAALKASSLFFRHVPDERITHFADVTSSSQSVALGCVCETTTLVVAGSTYTIDPMYVENLVIPSTSVSLAVRASNVSPAERARAHLRTRLAHVGVTAPCVPDDLPADGLATLIGESVSYADAQSTAVALLFHHIALMHLDGTTQYPAYLYQNILNSQAVLEGGLQDTAYTISQLGDAWRMPSAYVDADGNAILDPSTNALMYRLVQDPMVAATFPAMLNTAIALARNDMTLQGQLWTQNYGTPNAPYGATASTGPGAAQARRAGDGSATNWQLTNVSSYAGFSIGGVSFDDAQKQLSLTVTNNYLRHLTAYIQLSDADNNPITLDDAYLQDNDMSSSVGLSADLSYFDGGTAQIKRWVQAIGPVSTICGVPLSGDPVTITLPIPDGVPYVNFYFGSATLSGPVDPDVTPSGALLTGLVELLLPPILLGLGDAIENSSIVKSLTGNKDFMTALMISLAPAAVAELITDPLGFLEHFGDSIATTLLKALQTWLTNTGGTAAAAAPVLGFAAEYFSAAVTAAEIGVATYDMTQSVGVYKVALTRTVDLQVTLNPDPEFNIFPAEAVSYAVLVNYDNEATSPVAAITGNIPTTESTPITVTFLGVPAAGTATASAVFYAANGWVAAQGTSASLDMIAGSDATVSTSLTLKDTPVPLTASTIYTHSEMVQYVSGTYQWVATGTPPSTVTTDGDNAVRVPNGIALSQAAEIIAYAWQGTGMDLPLDSPQNPVDTASPAYLVQTLSVAGSPQSGYATPGVCYTGAASVSLVETAASGATGVSFFLDPSPSPYDPSDPTSGCQLRGFTATFNEAPDLAGALAQSWGRFLTAIDRIAIHPQGRAYGLSRGLSSLQMLMLPPAPAATAPATATLICGPGTREGLLTNPVALAVAPSAALYVLESGDPDENLPARVQAFDLTGNPAQIFAGQEGKLSYFCLDAPSGSVTYLDIAVEAAGYVYVLYFTGGGTQVEDYVLDIYVPDGSSRLASMAGIAAAGVAVSLARDIYTLNYQPLTGTANRPEPTISHWLPSVPSP